MSKNLQLPLIKKWFDLTKSGSFTTYENALEDALNLIAKCDLQKFQKDCPNNKFHWGNYAKWLSQHYR